MMKTWNGLCTLAGIAIRFDVHEKPRTWTAFKRELLAGPIDTNKAELDTHWKRLTAMGSPFTYAAHIVPGLAKRGIIRLAMRADGCTEPAPLARTRYATLDAAQAAAAGAAADPGRLVILTDTALEAGPVVEVWAAADYDRRESELFTVAERAAARAVYTHDAIYFHKVKPARARAKGTAQNRAAKNARRTEQRRLFAKIRADHPKVKRDWILRKMAAKHPRKTGWKLRTLKANTAGLK